jgi:signal recognition particle GTPase
MSEEAKYDNSFNFERKRKFITIDDEVLTIFKDNSNTPEELSKHFIVVTLIGMTGHGKSTTANTLVK